jgi:crotonobetainyl-CoA:carnitine CoA-transferase CaiB-like acyl-CoA transferase
MANPLKGIKVLELGQFIAGPFAGLQLADMGAQVIKVERPGQGDPFRAFGLGPQYSGYSHNFCAFNRNKLSLTIDLNDARGKEVFRRAASQSDVVLENFRPGVMKRLGLDYESLRVINPRLVYCSVAGFSEDGPYCDRPAYDAVGQAVSGLMSLMVDPADPRILGPTISDQVTGMQAYAGVVAALYERERSGTGSRVDITMVEATLSIIPDFFTAYTEAGVVMSQESRSAVSLSFSFMCGDGKLLAVHVSSIEKFWQALVAAIERPDMAEDPRFSSRLNRIKNYEALLQVLRPIFAAMPRTHWAGRLSEHDVPSAVVNSIPEAMHDPEVVHLGMFHELVHARYGKMTAMRRAVRINGERESEPLPPPALGEHTDALLREFGYASHAIGDLREAGIV